MDDWLYEKFPWYRVLPRHWKQITHRIVMEFSPARFLALSALHEALSMCDDDVVLELLAEMDASDGCIELIEGLLI